MFLKNRKILPWICCMAAAFFLSFRLVVLDENNQGDSVANIAVTTTFFYSMTEASVPETTTVKYFMTEREESVESTDVWETESSVFYKESGGRRITLSSVLLAFGLIFAVLFIFFMQQERPYLGPEIEVFLLSICVLRIRQPIDAAMFLQIGYLWILFCFLLVSMRCLWTWLRKGFPIDWSTGHRLGRMVVGDSGKQSRYLAVQFVFCILALIGGIWLLLSAQQGFYLFLWISEAGCLMVVILTVYCFMKLAYDMDHLSEQICRLHQGNPVLLRAGAFAGDEEKLIDFNRQRDEAVHTAVTSERFKVDLISNVSHDLRTPLTAILGYGELLKGEKLSLEGTKQLEELNRKAGYMRDLVDSLFELTKVSSGVVECKKDRIDLIRLLEQTIGLFDDQLSERDLSVRRHYEADSLLLITDGSRLHQVFANLIGNAIKYSLKGTRIHLEVKESEEEYRIRMVNTASYEMDFDSAEILQRFVRGDKARTTKGSGLGLAIAQTYTESVGGRFEVKIDGDQFNAIVGLPKN